MSLLLLTAGLLGQATKAEGLVDGRCGIAESGSAFNRCTLVETRGELTVLANNGAKLLLKARPSEILRIGALGPRATVISPGLQAGLPQTLAGLGISAGDAERSSNVRVIQARASSGIPLSLVFVAQRSANNLDQLNAVLLPVDNVSTVGGNSGQVSQLAPADSSLILADFDRAFQRIEGLYEALLFNEADRVLDRTEAELRLISQRFAIYAGASEVIAVLYARLHQIERLRELRSYDYQIAQEQAEQRYNRIQIEKALAEAQRRRERYLLAVEQRKTAEAHARSWWAIWMATRPAQVNTVVNNNVIITR